MTQEQITTLIVNCPSFYKVLAPNSVAEYEKSQQSLELYISTTYATTHSSPEAFLMDIGGVTSAEDLTRMLTKKIKNELKTLPEDQKETFSGVLKLCPLFWD